VSLASDEYKNVFGETLQSCSSDGMGLTGWTRNGHCIDYNDDQGSHHICINLSPTSTTGGNFCSVTGQSNWCSSSMPCHDDSSLICQVQNWCVCQWAFASYIQNTGGCDKIQELQCIAINMQALEAYRNHRAAYSNKIASALVCLEERCGLTCSSQSL
jgi:uncharacterized protein (DUF2237 family)